MYQYKPYSQISKGGFFNYYQNSPNGMGTLIHCPILNKDIE